MKPRTELLYAKTKEGPERVAYYKFLEKPSRIGGFDLDGPVPSPTTTEGEQLSGCNIKVCALGKQVKLHLGLPLDKRNHRVRTSNWSRKVLSKEQRR